ncbi:ubiquitin-conjugating enzyme E2 24 [Pyrus ussuriensis x Pyrus communis]|uniref:Ubiquitin-conjugating enzyme E2 24 n=1 Tax=Pyrus ussuriensis x Pyrus communis TaxID=2448454 RepID=A0A5N5IDL5_9ROSA|nr:ubiquitin-conjugating enzyme E2 24 [Pyrus ussuriensis x Pyrus communis]
MPKEICPTGRDNRSQRGLQMPKEICPTRVTGVNKGLQMPKKICPITPGELPKGAFPNCRSIAQLPDEIFLRGDLPQKEAEVSVRDYLLPKGAEDCVIAQIGRTTFTEKDLESFSIQYDTSPLFKATSHIRFCEPARVTFSF